MGAEAERAMDQLFDLAVVLGDLMNSQLAQHGLTPARAEVLWVLRRRGPLTQRELSQTLKCTPRNVTGLVDALQNAGFAERAPHPTDRRAVMVSLTEQGRTLIGGWGTERDYGTAQLFGDTSATDLTAFTMVLDRVLNKLRTAYQAD